LRAELRRSWKAGTLLEMQAAIPGPRRWRTFASDFPILAHDFQQPPEAANGGGPWTVWLVLGGRGAGKTRLGAEWVRALALGRSPYAERKHGRIALVGESEHDVREVMVEGVSGILAISPRAERPQWSPSRKRLEWHNGAIAQAFSADDPESLRGPAFDAAWCDELAKWRYAQAAWDTLQLTLRKGRRPRQLITTTPRPTALIKRLLEDKRTAVTRAPTRINAAHLAPTFLAEIAERYEGTRLGRQELEGELIDERPDALWSRETIEECRVPEHPPLVRIVVGIDPPVAAKPGSAACGIVAAGKSEEGAIYVLEDATVACLAPVGWAMRAISLYRRWNAATLVAEVNQGGNLVRAVLDQVDANVPLRTEQVRGGKWLRAEPVAAMYAQGKVKHVGAPLRALEDEMCSFGEKGLADGRSPDRLDALVLAVTELTRKPMAEPRIRVFDLGPRRPFPGGTMSWENWLRYGE
jgi:phage terminase large subunit-like protein